MESEVDLKAESSNQDESFIAPQSLESQPISQECSIPTSAAATPAPLFTLPFALYLKPLPTTIYQAIPKNDISHHDPESDSEDSASNSISSDSSSQSSPSSPSPSSPSERNSSRKSTSLGPNAKLVPKKLRSDPHDLHTLEAVLSVANPQSASQPVAKLLSLLANADPTPGFDRLREFFDTRYHLPSASSRPAEGAPASSKSQQRKASLPATLSKLRKGSSSNSRKPSFSQRKHEEHLKDDMEALESANAFNPSLYATTSESEDLPGPLPQNPPTSPRRHPTSRSMGSLSRSPSKAQSSSSKKRSSKAPRLVLPARKMSSGPGGGMGIGGAVSSSSSSSQKTIPPKVIRFPVRLDLHSVRLAPAPKPKLQKSRSVASRSSFGGGNRNGRFGNNRRNAGGMRKKQASAEGALQFIRTPSTSSLRKGAVSGTRRVASDTEPSSTPTSGIGFNSEAAGLSNLHSLDTVASPESGYNASLPEVGTGNNSSGWALSTSPEKAGVNESSLNVNNNGISRSSVNGSSSVGNSSVAPSSGRIAKSSSATSASVSGGGDRKDSFISGTGSVMSPAAVQEGNRRPSVVQRFLDFGGLRKKGRSRSGTGGSEMSRRSASSASADEINHHHHQQQQQSSVPPLPNVPSVIASSQPQEFPSSLKVAGLDQREGGLASPIDLVSPTTEIKQPSYQSLSKDLSLSRAISASSGSDDAHAHAIEDEDDAEDVEALWTRRRAAVAKATRTGSRTESFGDSTRRFFRSSSNSVFAASEHDLGPVREGHAWAANNGTRESFLASGGGDIDEEDSFDDEEEEEKEEEILSAWDEDGSELAQIEEGEDFLSLLREAAKLSLSPEALLSVVEQQEAGSSIQPGLESRGSQSQTPRGGSSPRNSLQHLSDKAKGKLPEGTSGSRSPLTPNGHLSELPALLTSSSSSSLHQVTPPGSFELERQAEMNANVEAIAEVNSRAEERFKDLEKADWWPSGSSDPFPVVISLALGLHFGWEGIMNLCYGPGSNSCPPATQGQEAAGDFAPLGRAADMEERGRRGAGRVSDWWAGVQNAQESEATTAAPANPILGGSPKEGQGQDAVSDVLVASPQDSLDLRKPPSEIAVDDEEIDLDPEQVKMKMERSSSNRFGKWLGIKARGGSMSSSKDPAFSSLRKASTSAGSESQEGRPPSPSISQLGEIRARERMNSQRQGLGQQNDSKEKEDRNRTWKDWYNLTRSIKGWVEAYELARIRAGLSREIGVEPAPPMSQSQSNDLKSDSALSDEEDVGGDLSSLVNNFLTTNQNSGTDSGFHEREKSQAQMTDSSLLGVGAALSKTTSSSQRNRRPSATSTQSEFSESSSFSLAPPRSEISEGSNTSSNPRSAFSPSPIPDCVLKDITERENGFRRAAGIPEGLGAGEDGEEHVNYRWAKSRLRRKEIGTSTILFASSLSYHLSQLSTSDWVHRSAWELDYLEMCVFRSSLVAERFPPPGTQIVPSTSAYRFQEQDGSSKESDRTNLCPMPNLDGSWNALKWKNWLGTVKEGQIIVPAVSWQTWWTLISVLNGADGSGRSYNLQVKTPEEPFEELTDMNAVYI